MSLHGLWSRKFWVRIPPASEKEFRMEGIVPQSHGENMWAVELASSNRHSVQVQYEIMQGLGGHGVMAYWATLGIEPRTPSTLRKDHTTRPSSQCRSRQGNRRAGINRTEAKLKRTFHF